MSANDNALLVFGDNREGQAGIASGEDFVPTPLAVNGTSLEADHVLRISTNKSQSFVVTSYGTILTAGSNDNNELGRAGKRSLLRRVDAIETFQITEASLGDGFVHLICDDGRVLSWGRNDLGQLGNSSRESKDKPRVNTTLTEPILQIASGGTHVVALTKSGRVITWGGNRKGQLGDGQLTSSTVPLSPIQLRHRPVVSVACGENHCLALTVGGNCYAWGDNAQGQLGLGDTSARLRPEQIKALKLTGAKRINAGRNHSLVVSRAGLLLTFGSNTSGQCGHESDAKIIPLPTVVERFRGHTIVSAVGGSGHSLVLCEMTQKEVSALHAAAAAAAGSADSASATGTAGVELDEDIPEIESAGVRESSGSNGRPDDIIGIDGDGGREGGGVSRGTCNEAAAPIAHKKRYRVFVMGLNSSGQLGTSSFNSTNTPLPLPLPPSLSADFNPTYLGTGPLAFHSFVLSGDTPPPQPALPVVELAQIQDLVGKFRALAEQAASSSTGGAGGVAGGGIVRSTSREVSTFVVHGTKAALTTLREVVAAAYSSIPVLNASFHHPSSSSSASPGAAAFSTSSSSNSRHYPGSGQGVNATGHSTLSIDLRAVRSAYELLQSTEAHTPLLMNTLSRATLHLAEQLKECPFDDAENLPVFLIVLENPLMLKPASNQVAIEMVIRGILAIPNIHRKTLFKWLGCYPSEYFGRILQVLLGFLACVVGNSALRTIDVSPVVMVLETLFECNQEMKIVPEHMFYSVPLARAVNLEAEWVRFRNQGKDSRVFNFCSYPFLIDLVHKFNIIHFEFESHKNLQVAMHRRKYEIDSYLQQLSAHEGSRIPADVTAGLHLPRGIALSVDQGMQIINAPGLGAVAVPVPKLTVWFEVQVSREKVVEDLLDCLETVLLTDPDTLRLPMRAAFKGEMGLDLGGVRRELFTLAIRDMLLATNVLASVANGRMLWFTNHHLEQWQLDNEEREKEQERETKRRKESTEEQVEDEGRVQEEERVVEMEEEHIQPPDEGHSGGVSAESDSSAAVPMDLALPEPAAESATEESSDNTRADGGGFDAMNTNSAVASPSNSATISTPTTVTAATPRSPSGLSPLLHPSTVPSSDADATGQESTGAAVQPPSTPTTTAAATGVVSPAASSMLQDPSRAAALKGLRIRKYAHSLEFYLGLLVGLAAYNGIHVDLPLPPCIYKIMKGAQLTLSDLWAVDEELAGSMQTLLDFEDGAGSLEDVFGVTFTASANPLISSFQSSAIAQYDFDQDGTPRSRSATRAKAIAAANKYVDLVEGGSETYVTQTNRSLFVNRFVQHALYDCAALSIHQYLDGLRYLFSGPAVELCTSQELERIMCGTREVGNLAELRSHTSYKGCFDDKHQIIKWFWDFLESLSTSDKRKFLQFVTGSENVPLGGLSNIGLVIQSTAQENTALPTSHTCFSTLNIPSTYESAEQLQQRFRVALQYSQGFGLI